MTWSVQHGLMPPGSQARSLGLITIPLRPSPQPPVHQQGLRSSSKLSLQPALSAPGLAPQRPPNFRSAATSIHSPPKVTASVDQVAPQLTETSERHLT